MKESNNCFESSKTSTTDNDFFNDEEVKKFFLSQIPVNL
jgi:hypothetical protein